MKSKVLTALLSLVAAFSLWLYVITVVSPDSESTFYDIPVVVKNSATMLKKGLMLKPGQKPVVTLRLSGNRSDLIKLSSDNILVEVDAEKILQTGTAQLNYTISYPGNVPNNALTVENRNPDYIELEIWEYAEKTVPVVANYVGSRVEGYMVEGAAFNVQHIRISGRKDVVSKIETARVEIDLTDVTQSFTRTMDFVFCGEGGVEVDDKHVSLETDVLEGKKQVQVELTVSRVKEIPVEVNLIAGGGANSSHCEVEYSRPTIRVSGGEEELANVEKLVLGDIDLSKINGSKTFEMDVEAALQDTGLSNVTGATKISVTVTVSGLVTKELVITNIQPENTGGMNVYFNTEQLEVILRGPEREMAQIKASDVTAIADFSGLGKGTYAITAKFRLSDKFTAVGVVDSYTISADLGVAKEYTANTQTTGE